MSVIKARLREQADFISLSETLELLERQGEGCTLSDAAKYLLQFDFIDPFVGFLPEFVYCDIVYGIVKKLTSDVCRCLIGGLECVALDNSYSRVKMNCDEYGFERSKLIPLFEKHGIAVSNCAERSSQPACDDTRERLLQLEAENLRLVEQVAKLNRQLEEVTAATQEAGAVPVPQQATAAPRDDDEKPFSAKERNTLRKLVIGMAIAYHGYDHCAKRSGTATSIVSELARLDINIDADTVRKHLKEAAENVLPATIKP